MERALRRAVRPPTRARGGEGAGRRGAREDGDVPEAAQQRAAAAGSASDHEAGVGASPDVRSQRGPEGCGDAARVETSQRHERVRQRGQPRERARRSSTGEARWSAGGGATPEAPR